MSLRFEDNRGEIAYLPISKWEVANGRVSATLTNPDFDINSTIVYPLPIVEDKEDYSSCKIFLLKNRFHSKEDHCYSISIDKKRKGVIFPIKIYSSSGILPKIGSSKDADFLYRFLHIAFYHLLDSKSFPSQAIRYDKLSGPDLKVEDFYDDETVIFLYHDGSLLNPDVRKLYPSFLKYGYVPILLENDFNEIEMIDNDPNKHPLYAQTILNSINIDEVKNPLINEKFIEQIFSTILKYPLTPLSRFVLLYQVIELLIDKIALQYYQVQKPFDTSTSVLMIAADTAKTYRDTFSYLKEIQDKINKSIDKVKEESRRISILFVEKCNLQASDYSKFTSLAQSVVGAKRVCKDLPDFVYQLRNKIVHDYHNLAVENESIDKVMHELNIEFEKLIADIIIEYN
jgi:hypothetical protein